MYHNNYEHVYFSAIRPILSDRVTYSKFYWPQLCSTGNVNKLAAFQAK